MNIHVPAPELQSDIIAITGLAAHLDRAKAGLLERVKELQAEQEDRVRAGRPGAKPLGTQAGPQPGVGWPRQCRLTLRRSPGSCGPGAPTGGGVGGLALFYEDSNSWTSCH